MQGDGHEDMGARLDRLERENAWLKRLGLAWMLGTLALFIAGTDLFRAKARVTAEQFVLKDRKGQVRAVLGPGQAGASVLALKGRDGTDLIRLMAGVDNSAAMDFYDRGEMRMTMATSPAGTAVLNLFTRRSRQTAGLYVGSDGTTGLSFAEGLRGVGLALRPDGTSALDFTDGAGGSVGGLSSRGSGPVRAWNVGHSRPDLLHTRTPRPGEGPPSAARGEFGAGHSY